MNRFERIQKIAHNIKPGVYGCCGNEFRAISATAFEIPIGFSRFRCPMLRLYLEDGTSIEFSENEALNLEYFHNGGVVDLSELPY